MRINVSSPYGLTGSEDIDGLYVYINETKFTPANLPAPYKNNTVSYSGYNIDLPETEKPYWVMWAYRGRDNQITYSPCVCLMDFPAELMKVYNDVLLIATGNALNGVLTNSLAAADLVYPDSFSIAANLPYKWDRGNSPIGWYLVDGKRVGASSRPNKDLGTARDMYVNGYLGREGTMENTYSQDLMEAFAVTEDQGRTFTTLRMNWSAWVPTLDEFRTILGVIFQSGIPTSAQPITALTLEENKWYLTSTESTTEPGKLYAINSKGNLRSVSVSEQVAIQLLFEGKLS